MPFHFDGLFSDEDIDQLAQQEGLIFDEKRRELLRSMNSIDVQACPGSGKTTLIAAKLILLAKKWPFKYQGVCVLSHTNVAKDEIINRLKKTQAKEAQSLLSYPHFIGTIQEFVNRFLALPYIRQEVRFDKFLEGQEGHREVLFSDVNLDALCRSIYYKCNKASYDEIKTYLGTLFWLNTDKDLGFFGQRGILQSFKNDPSKKVSPKLLALKEKIISKGLFQYRDMYVYAELALNESEGIIHALGKRFPFVLLDEMQDTQEFQDDLLRKVFPLDDEVITVQRFGDPDQAIFNGINGEEPNKSYNRNDKLSVINQSHRFNGFLASVIKGLSFKEVPLASELSPEALEERKCIHVSGGEFEHTIFMFDDGVEKQVIQAFADHVSRQFADKYKQSDKFTVKVVGAVGNEIDSDNQVKIVSYCASFKKGKSKNSFRESSLHEAVNHCRDMTDVDWSGRYKILNGCWLKILRLANKRDVEEKYFNANSLKEFLKEKGEWESFRKLFYYLINSDIKLGRKDWSAATANILKSFDIDAPSVELTDYLLFDSTNSSRTIAEKEYQDKALRPFLGNTLIHKDGFKIELSTIHGVKGETHDATLVLETKNYSFDLEDMLPFLTGDRPNYGQPNKELRSKPHHTARDKANRQFMRQLYVAMSRPKHLLCLAIRSDHINDEQERLLLSKGWCLKKLSSA